MTAMQAFLGNWSAQLAVLATTAFAMLLGGAIGLE